MAGDKDLSKVLEDDDANEVLEEIGYVGVASRENAVSVQNIIRFESTPRHIMLVVWH